MGKKIKSKSLRVTGKNILIQGTSGKTYKDYGLTGGAMIPAVVSTEGSTLLMAEISGSNLQNMTPGSAFNDMLSSTALGIAPSVGGLKREQVPNYTLTSPLIGQSEELNLSTVYVDKTSLAPPETPLNLSAGLQTRYLGAAALNDRRHNGTIFVFEGFPKNLVVFSGSKGESSPVVGGFSEGTQDHFPGEAKITNVIDFAASPCRGFIDGDTRKLTMLTATGSFYTLDIEGTPFVDADQKTLTYAGLADPTIVASLPLPQTGAINNGALLPNERFAASGFTYERSQFGPDSKGTDSIVFGGWMK